MDADTAFVLGAKVALLGLWFLCFFVAERLLPAALKPRDGGKAAGLARLRRNGALWLLNSGLSPLVVVPLTAWAAAHSLPWRPDAWGGWSGLLADLLLLDFLIYWWHRANHEVPFLWRFHEVHHLDRFLDTTSAVRFHFGEVLLSGLARAVIILLLGFPLLSVLMFETLILMASIFHHSNLRLPKTVERALSSVIITPGIHWVHHHACRRDTDSNYGTILVLWDQLFGSRNRRERRLDMRIGVEGRGGEVTLRAALLQPFRRRLISYSGQSRAAECREDSVR